MVANAVVTDWPSGSANTGWPQEPTGMLMPGRVQGWPAGTQRAANAAERLLSQAVAWWDVGQYRDGDRFLRNRGTGGELLNLRLGSALAPNSNDPRYLAPENQGYVYLPGVASNYLSVPDEAALDITGDIDLRVRVAADTLTSASGRTLIAKWSATGNQRSYMLQLLTGGGLTLFWSPDGTAAAIATGASSAVIPFGDGEAGWIRATIDVDNGASGRTITFYTSTDGVTWGQLGNVITQAGTTSIFAGTALCEVGSNTSGVNNLFTGKVYRAQVLDGIGGTTVLDIDCDAITSGSATSFTAVTNQTVTINRSTSGRKSVAVPSRANRGAPVFLFGTDDFLDPANTQGPNNRVLRLMDQNTTPDQAPAYTMMAFARVWGGGPVIGRADASGGGVTPGSSGLVLGMTNNVAAIRPRGQLGVTANITGGSTPSGSASVYCLTTAPLGNGTYIHQVFGNGVGGTRTTSQVGLGRAPLRVGEESTTYDFEFFAAAYWYRILTPNEIKRVSDYYTGRNT